MYKMWIVFAGRITETLKSAINEYIDKDVYGIEMVDDYEVYKNKIQKEKVECILVMDSGLYTLRDWTSFRKLQNDFKDVPILFVSRYKEITPEKVFFGGNVTISLEDNQIFIKDLIGKMKILEERRTDL